MTIDFLPPKRKVIGQALENKLMNLTHEPMLMGLAHKHRLMGMCLWAGPMGLRLSGNKSLGHICYRLTASGSKVVAVFELPLTVTAYRYKLDPIFLTANR